MYDSENMGTNVVNGHTGRVGEDFIFCSFQKVIDGVSMPDCYPFLPYFIFYWEHRTILTKSVAVAVNTLARYHGMQENMLSISASVYHYLNSYNAVHL
jgi:hypothetical protein